MHLLMYETMLDNLTSLTDQVCLTVGQVDYSSFTLVACYIVHSSGMTPLYFKLHFEIAIMVLVALTFGTCTHVCLQGLQCQLPLT